MQDNLPRRFVKRLALWRYRIDLAVTRWIDRCRGEGPRYELRGHCNSCGDCCEAPMIHLSRWLYHTRSIRRAVLWWHRVINGFGFVAYDRIQQALVFRCTHFDPVTRRCDSYDSRPGFCRDYPRNLVDDPRPEFLPRCSFYAYAVNAEEIRASLRELDMPPEKLAELERRFYVVEPLQTVSPDTHPDSDHDPGRQPPRAA